MKDRHTGRPRGSGFIAYVDPTIVDIVIAKNHIINEKLVDTVITQNHIINDKQQIANSIAFLTNGFISIVCTANHLIITSKSAPPRSDSKLDCVIKVFLTVSMILLVFELVAYFREWDFNPLTVESASAEVIEFTRSQINVVARKLHGKELIETMSHKVINKSFGFDTTIEEAQRAINAADVEAQSAENDISLVKLMGRYSDNMLLLSFMHRK
ncbi:hypothetical protein FXO37_31818 [Capsicum annuum]|nr:hypothetical protein FXO37_31818 [Capsicum annuum]